MWGQNNMGIFTIAMVLLVLAAAEAEDTPESTFVSINDIHTDLAIVRAIQETLLKSDYHYETSGPSVHKHNVREATETDEEKGLKEGNETKEAVANKTRHEVVNNENAKADDQSWPQQAKRALHQGRLASFLLCQVHSWISTMSILPLIGK